MGVRPYSRVVWSEGMHLAQHHFQAQSRYFEASTAFALSRLFFKPYGFIRLILDEEAIREGTITLLEARGVMPDGLAFEFPQGDPLPPPLVAADGGDSSGDSLVAHLAIPVFRAGKSNCDDQGELSVGASSENRYRPQKGVVQDENTGEDKKDLLFASKNFRIIYASEITENLVTLPLAKVQRGPSGHFEFLHDFIPPCLDLGATRRLPAMLGGLVEMLRSKGEVMAQRRAMVGDDLSDLSSEEVLSYWMSHSIHSGLAGLKHLMTLPRCHPEDLFREMARLAGALSTFSTEFEPGDLPPYDHDDLTEGFTLLDGRVRRLLQVMVPESFIAVHLGREGPNVLSAPLDDARVFRKSEWVLQVSSESGTPEVLRNVPALVKVCSAEDILRLVDDANPGLPLEHVPQPPSSIPRRLGSQYFRVVQTGPCWQLIQSRSSIGIYVPDVLADVRMELVVVQT
jgi:type VI secretion system protein ImpJ